MPSPSPRRASHCFRHAPLLRRKRLRVLPENWGRCEAGQSEQNRIMQRSWARPQSANIIAFMEHHFSSSIPALWYAGPIPHADGTLRLEADEARHARALRLGVGDRAILLDGKGRKTEAEVVAWEKSGPLLRCLNNLLESDAGWPYIAIGFGMIDDRSRVEWLVEKSVELGVRELLPIRTQRSEGHLHRERLLRVAVAALKQSQRSYLPLLHQPTTLAQALRHSTDPLILCHEQRVGQQTLNQALQQHGGNRAMLLIGPEGGFTEAEVAEAETAGALVATLGPARLRAETAAIAAVAIAGHQLLEHRS